MAGYGLSKSRIISWKQCPKKLWLQIHRPELIEDSQPNEQIFQVGNEVGEVARGLYPEGILIDDEDLSDALDSTRRAMDVHPNKPIFEAAFQHEGVLVRADLMLPARKGYRMVEVKSSASVKPYHVDDCAIQAWTLGMSGIPLRSVELAHIDTSFVYQGDGDYRGLFRYQNLDEQVHSLIEQVPEWIAEARCTLAGSEPCIEPGSQCNDPFECPFKSYCARDLVLPDEPEYGLDILSGMHETKKQKLRSMGYADALEVPVEHLNDTQKRIQRVSRTGIPELDPEAGGMLDALPYPRCYLDFETINFAVPRWAKTSPYRTQVTFQWSCHIEEAPGKVRHEMFLDVSGSDPRRACAERMIAVLGEDGPVFVYYQSFEKGRIMELSELFPDLADMLLSINDRIVDLYPIAREHYYHPDMKGSWSIKSVLPTVAPDLDYTLLEVGNGGDAQEAYKEIIHPETSDERRMMLTKGLEEYCALDTLAMVKLAWHFQGFGG